MDRREIDWWKLCDEFRRSWKSAPTATHTDVFSFLQTVDFENSTNGAEAFIAVIAVDLDIRFERNHGDNPDAKPPKLYRVEDYLSNSPLRFNREVTLDLISEEARLRQAYGDVIVLSEYRHRFPEVSERLLKDHLAEFIGKSGPLLDGYDWERKLGEGGMGSVHLYKHRRNQSYIALKIGTDIDRVNAIIVQEATKLLELSHPNLIRIIELHANAVRPFYTMEFVDGRPFKREILSSNPEESLLQLVHVLHYLHCQRIIHCDVKPDNVLIQADGRLVLLDLGIAVITNFDDLHDPTTPSFRGTLAFMSPERIQKQPVDASADWYSVGVLLFELLTGKPAFTAAGEDKILVQKLNALSPKDISPDVPEQLNDLCIRMMSPIPADRPAYDEIISCLCGGRKIRREQEPLGRFWVGRTSYLKKMRLAFDHAFPTLDSKATVLLQVRGPSGIGKTALIERFLDEHRKAPLTLIVRGKCYAGGVRGTYGGFNTLVNSLVEKLLERCHNDKQHLTSYLPLESWALTGLDLFKGFQQLIEMAGISDASSDLSADPLERRQQAFAAFRDVLRLVSRDFRVVLFLDDMQWAGKDSGELFNAVFQATSPPPCFVIYAHRDESELGDCLELIEDRSQAASDHSMQLVVDRLSSAEIQAMLENHLGDKQVDSATLRRMVQQADGHPLQAEVFVREVIQAGETGLNLTLEEVFERQLERLDDRARRVVDYLAVAGRPILGAVLGVAVGVTDNLNSVFRQLASSGLIKLDSRRRVDTYHDQVREVAIRLLGPASARYKNYSRELAVNLGETDEYREQQGLLATLYEQANDDLHAGPLHETAAESEAKRLRFDAAAEHQRRAIHCLERLGKAVGPALAKRAAYLSLNGEVLESAKLYQQASLSFQGEKRVDLLCQAAMRYLNVGHIVEGKSALREVFAESKLQYPSPYTPLLNVIWQLPAIKWREFRGLRLRQRATRDSNPGPDLRELEALWAGISGLSVIEPLTAADLRLRYLRTALDAGQPKHALRALIAYVGFVAALGGGTSRPRTERLSRRIEDIAKDHEPMIGGEYASGVCLFAQGVAAHLQGRWQTAIEMCEGAAEKLTSEIDANWERNAAQTFSMWAHQFNGNVKALARLQPQRYEIAAKREDLFSQLNFGTRIRAFIDAASGDWETAQQHLDQEEDLLNRLPEGAFFVQHHNVLLANVDLALGSDRGRDAWAAIEGRWPDYRRGQLHRVQQVCVDFWKSYGQAALGAALKSVQDRRCLDGANKAIRKLRGERVDWAQGLASLLSGGQALIRSDRQVAIKELSLAKEVLARVPMHLHAATAELCLAMLTGEDTHAAYQRIIDLGVNDPDTMARSILPTIGLARV